ncbi:MAG: methyltransferase domain-containing protein [Gemmatimonadaceae bacterium]|nr:methyltransferase domain-containing protein [Gemmatimonadaceae bacterium]
MRRAGLAVATAWVVVLGVTACGEGTRPREAGAQVAAAVGGARRALAWPRDTGDALVPLAPPGLPADRFPGAARPVSSIVAPQWTDESIRDAQHEADTVMWLMNVRRGMAVADIGAGSGYYVARLSRRVGPQGLVYGNDIIPRYLRLLRERVDRDGLANVRLSLGDAHDPRLPARSLDAAIMIHMYHEIEAPYALLANLAGAMRRDARLGILDMRRRTDQHGTPPALLRCELEAVGYRQLAYHDLGYDGYLAVFRSPDSVDVAGIAGRAARCAKLATLDR